jgi:hypothetical protein
MPHVLSPAPADSRELPWESFHRRWTMARPPLRPHADVLAAVRAATAFHEKRVLLLGVTPDLVAAIGPRVAVDCSAGSIAHVWPGNTAGRGAVRGDWRHLPLQSGTMSAAVGDGSLNCLEYPFQYVQVLSEIARVVGASGTVAIRVFLRPDAGESLLQVRRCALSGAVASVGALKWRVAQALCWEERAVNVTPHSVLQAFNNTFADRATLAAAAGWSECELSAFDAYEGVEDIFSFPTARQLLEVIPAGLSHARFVSSGVYELADRCPILSADVVSAVDRRP